MRVSSKAVVFVVILVAVAQVSANFIDYEEEEDEYEFVDLLDAFYGKLDLTCAACTRLLSRMMEYIDSGLSVPELLDIAKGFCVNHTERVSLTVCQGTIDVMGPEVIYVANNTDQSIETACSFLYHSEHCNSSMPAFEIDVPGGKPPVNRPPPNEGLGTLRILHISDFHIDYLYKEGTPVECEDKLCCREFADANTTVADDAVLAGYWGAENGNCDLPLRTLELMLQEAAQLNPDIVYFTGDHPPHDAWMQSRETNLGAVDFISETVYSVFPDIPVLQSIGNHDSFPENSFPVPSVYDDGFSAQWLYDYLAEKWEKGGIPAANLETVRQGGFYTYSPFPGLRVIAVNTMYCYTWNWWLLMDNNDPTGQLAWLTGVLTDAEAAGEKVHILDHIATGDRDCQAVWSHQINRIYTRFESTITAIFSGHHHSDHYRILWDVEDNTRAVGVSYLIPSATELERKSPAFRIFTIDGGYENATWAPIDHETYLFNLTQANYEGDTHFHFAYSARSAYQINDLNPETWAELGWQMATNSTLFDEYIRHYFNYWQEPEELSTCDMTCRQDLLCEMYRGDSSDLEPCERIREQVEISGTF